MEGDEDRVLDVAQRITLDPKRRVPIPDGLKRELDNRVTPLQEKFNSAIAGGRFEDALKAAQSIAVTVGEVIDPSHEEAEEIIYSLGDVFRNSARLDKFIQFGEWVLGQREALLGTNSPRLRVWLDWVANIYEEVGRRDEALQLYERVDQIFGRCPHCYGDCCKGNRSHHRLRESQFYGASVPADSAHIGAVAIQS